MRMLKSFMNINCFMPSNIYNLKKKGGWSPISNLYGKNILILGPGENAMKNKHKIIKFIKDKKPFVIALNSLNYISDKLINVRTICHPKRIILDFKYFK